MTDEVKKHAAMFGNKFWKARATHGRDKLFTDPQALWEACEEYFEWVVENPLYEDRLVSFQGVSTHEPVAKMRAMTIKGLCTFLGIVEITWRAWRSERKDLAEVIARVDQIIVTQKFEGAAADLLNGAIIARDLGLADKSEITGANGGPIETTQTRRILLAPKHEVSDDKT